MSTKLKVIGLAVVAVCAFGAVSASAQAAVHWNVNGAALASGVSEEVAETVTLEEFEVEGGSKAKVATLTVSGLLRLSCTGLAITGGKITGTKTDSASSLKFTGCTVQNTKGETQAKCTAKSEGAAVGTIVTSGNTSELIESGGKAYDKFTPTGGTFATVVVGAVEGGSCALSGTNKVTGTAGLQLETGTNATTLMGTANAASATGAGAALSYGARSATLDGTGTLKLKSGKTWGVSF